MNTMNLLKNMVLKELMAKARFLRCHVIPDINVGVSQKHYFLKAFICWV